MNETIKDGVIVISHAAITMHAAYKGVIEMLSSFNIRSLFPNREIAIINIYLAVQVGWLLAIAIHISH